MKPILLYATRSLRPLEIYEYCARLRFHLASVAVGPAVEVSRNGSSSPRAQERKILTVIVECLNRDLRPASSHWS
jgi:hypothetical protein